MVVKVEFVVNHSRYKSKSLSIVIRSNLLEPRFIIYSFAMYTLVFSCDRNHGMLDLLIIQHQK